MVPSPTLDHQELLGRVYGLVMNKMSAKSGLKIVFAPLDLIVSRVPLKIYQPDLMIFREEAGIVNEDRLIEGPPDLIIEILSPTSRHKDYVEKKEAYERLGVQEYWILDPETHSISMFSKSHAKGYGIGKIMNQWEIRSQIFPEIAFGLDSLFPRQAKNENS